MLSNRPRTVRKPKKTRNVFSIFKAKTAEWRKQRVAWQRYVLDHQTKVRHSSVRHNRVYQALARLSPHLQWKIDGVLARGWIFRNRLARMIFTAEEGHLSWYVLFTLSVRNLKARWSRTVVTGGAIAVGICAIVFLVSFGYGLQDIVTKRLVHPDSLRLVDVQTDSTAMKLNHAATQMFAQLSGVTDVTGMVTLAGSLSINNQKTEVVVVGTENSFLNYSHVIQVAGVHFSEAANARYTASTSEINDLLSLIAYGGRVAGTQDEFVPKVGELITETPLTIRGRDETYVPVYEKPDSTGKVMGYLRGSVTQQYAAQEVWGGTYQTSGVEGQAYRSPEGTWLGKWVKVTAPIWNEVAPTVYVPQDGGPTMGYMPEGAVTVLSALEVEKNYLSEKVLGTTTDTASASADLVSSLTTQAPATLAAELQELMIAETASVAAIQKQVGATVSVARTTPKEILLSSGLLNTLKIPVEQAVGKEITLTMIVSGGMIEGMAGKVLSEPVAYKVVGVLKDDSRPVAYVPFGDIASMGVDRYSLVKLLVNSETQVRTVREKIEALGFLTQSLSDTLLQVDRMFRIMRFLLAAIGAIALIVAILGMFNTLTISLLERTREIGVMKTLGTTNRDVVRLYLAESMVMGLVGGLVGSLLGIGLGQVINAVFWALRKSMDVMLFNTPPGLIFIMMLIAMVVGLLTGIIPAKRATEVSALNALRYE